MNNQKNEQTAQEKAKVKVEFQIHLLTFVVVITILAVINLILTPGYIWFKWPLLGWGIGIVFHAIHVNSSGKSIKEKMIEKEMKKINDVTFKNKR